MGIARCDRCADRAVLLFDGVVTLILAVMIWRTWPSSTGWVIGTLVGISMCCCLAGLRGWRFRWR